MPGDFRNDEVHIDNLSKVIDKYNNQDFILYGGKLGGVIQGNRKNIFATYTGKTPEVITFITPENTEYLSPLHSLLKNIQQGNIPQENKGISSLKKGDVITLPEGSKSRGGTDISNCKAKILNPIPDKDNEIYTKIIPIEEKIFVNQHYFKNAIFKPITIKYQGRLQHNEAFPENNFLLEKILYGNKIINMKSETR